MQAVFLDYATMGPDLDLAALERLVPDLVIHDATADHEVANRIRDAALVFTNKIRLDDELIASARALRFIGLTATGTDNIDLDAAARHGIAVANIRAYCTRSVVEHVFGVMLMLAHSLHRYRASVAAGRWQDADAFCLMDHPIRELSTMTLGVVGHGVLGSAVAETGRAFGMRVLVSARRDATEVANDRTPFDDVIRQADVLSLHCPLTASTRGMIGEQQLKGMKDDAILVNTARGALVDTAALAAALDAGSIGGAAVDVLPNEPPVDGDPLLDYRGDNLVVTPHIAWATDAARQNAIDELAANAAAFLNGERRNRVD